MITKIDIIDNLSLMSAIGGVALYGTYMILEYTLLRDFIPALSDNLSVNQDSSLFPYVTFGLNFRYIRFRKKAGSPETAGSAVYIDEVKKFTSGWSAVWIIPVVDLLLYTVNTVLSPGGLKALNLLNHIRTDDFVIICLCAVWIGYTDSRLRSAIKAIY